MPGVGASWGTATPGLSWHVGHAAGSLLALRKGASAPGGAGGWPLLHTEDHRAKGLSAPDDYYLLSWATVLGSRLTGFWVGWWLGGSSVMDTVKKVTV